MWSINAVILDCEKQRSYFGKLPKSFCCPCQLLKALYRQYLLICLLCQRSQSALSELGELILKSLWSVPWKGEWEGHCSLLQGWRREPLLWLRSDLTRSFYLLVRRAAPPLVPERLADPSLPFLLEETASGQCSSVEEKAWTRATSGKITV